MPAWLLSLLKMIGTLLVEKLVAAITNYAKELYEEHKTKKEVLEAVKQLRNSKTEDEIRSAIRNLTP